MEIRAKVDGKSMLHSWKNINQSGNGQRSWNEYGTEVNRGERDERNR